MFGERLGWSRRLLLGCVLGGLVGVAQAEAGQCGSGGATGSVRWRARWCDEFNGARGSAIEAGNWRFDTGAGGWGNKELETYCAPGSQGSPCDPGRPNAYLDGEGHLAIQVYGLGGAYTSARLKTEGLKEFHSGRVEASLKMPSHAGLWPAFWMLGSQAGVSWPAVGESDIMENWPATSKIPGPGATGNRSTLHTRATAGRGIGGEFRFPAGERVDTAFHRYGQIWSANMIQFYVDDPARPFYVVTAADLPADDVWPFSSAADSFFVILNVAVGGTLGSPTDAGAGTQAPMLVDYVRVYEPSGVPAPVLKAQGGLRVAAGATSGNRAGLTVSNRTGTGRVAFSCRTTAPGASCVVWSRDPLNRHTVDFSASNSESVEVEVNTAGGTAPGRYTVTVQAFTVSSSDSSRPSVSTSFDLTVD